MENILIVVGGIISLGLLIFLGLKFIQRETKVVIKPDPSNQTKPIVTTQKVDKIELACTAALIEKWYRYYKTVLGFNNHLADKHIASTRIRNPGKSDCEIIQILIVKLYRDNNPSDIHLTALKEGLRAYGLELTIDIDLYK